MAAEVDYRFRDSEECKLLSKLVFIQNMIDILNDPAKQPALNNKLIFCFRVSYQESAQQALTILKGVYNSFIERLAIITKSRLSITREQFYMINSYSDPYHKYYAKGGELFQVSDKCNQQHDGMKRLIDEIFEKYKDEFHDTANHMRSYDLVVTQLASYEPGSAVLKMKYLKYKLKYLALKNRN
jgi:hypothetical protein